MKKTLFPILLTVLLTVAVIICFVPQTGIQVEAVSGNHAIEIGADVLKTNANTDSAQTVYYGSTGGLVPSAIAWRVIGYDGTGNEYTKTRGAMTLLASESLKNNVLFNPSAYYVSDLNNHYAGSILQNNVDELYESLFSADEKSAIESRILNVDEYSDSYPYSTGVSETETSGYLWPLSTAEALSLPSDTFRCLGPCWWLRSPGERSDLAVYVDNDGHINNTNGYVSLDEAVRPAFNIVLSSVLITSAAKGGKNSGTLDTGALNPILLTSTNEWKLTLHDSNRDVFHASAETGAVLSANEGYNSWHIPIAYKNESDDPYSYWPLLTYADYVSVILADSNNNTLYYGNIDKHMKEEDVVEVTIPTGLSAGEYKLYVFCEKINKDRFTDYASAFSTINLAVNASPTEEFTVTYKVVNGTWSDGNAADKNETVASGNKPANVPTGMIASIGCTGGTWDTDPVSSTITGNKTFTYTFDAIPTHTVTFLDGQGNTLKEETVENGQAATAPDIPERDGYTFDGWDKDFRNITEDLVVTAKWKENNTPLGPLDPVSIKNAKVVLSKTAFTYNGKIQKPTVMTIKDLTLKEGTDYTVTWSDDSSKNVGTYTVTIKGIGNYIDTTKATYQINKAANTLKIKAKTAIVKHSKVKKKTQTLGVTKVIKFTKKGQGTKTYIKKSGTEKIIIAKKTGKVKVKKGLKKGTYKVKVKVKAKGNANYKASTWKIVTFTIKIK